MFETFTEQAREAIRHAQSEAREMGNEIVDVEHLLLGLFADKTTIASQVLTQFGLTIAPARALARRQLDAGASSPPEGRLLFSRDAKAALRSAYRFALGEPSTEHMLLVIVARGEGGACKILRQLGADPALIRFEIKRQAWPSTSTGRQPRLEGRSVPLLAELDFGD